MLPLLAAGPPAPLTCRLLDADSVHAANQPHTATLWAALSSHPTQGAQADCLCSPSSVPKRAMGGKYI